MPRNEPISPFGAEIGMIFALKFEAPASPEARRRWEARNGELAAWSGTDALPVSEATRFLQSGASMAEIDGDREAALERFQRLASHPNAASLDEAERLFLQCRLVSLLLRTGRQEEGETALASLLGLPGPMPAVHARAALEEALQAEDGACGTPAELTPRLIVLADQAAKRVRRSRAARPWLSPTSTRDEVLAALRPA